MSNVKEYKILSSTNPKKLVKEVNKQIRLYGWQPQGGIAVTFEPYERDGDKFDLNFYCQAMVR